MRAVVFLLASIAGSMASLTTLQSIPTLQPREWLSVPEEHYRNDFGDIVKDCSQAGDPLKVNRVEVTPFPLQSGQPLSVFINITLSEEVTDGEISLSVKYGFLPVYSNTFNLCSELLRAGTKCPLPKGVNIITVREVLPRAPPGNFHAKGIATDQYGEELVCVTIDFRL